MRFSERQGLSPPPMPLDPESMPDALRNRLWSAIASEVGAWNLRGNHRPRRPNYRFEKLWDEFYKLPIDRLPKYTSLAIDRLRKNFWHSRWHEVYDLVEFIARLLAAGNQTSTPFTVKVNLVLEQELASWRFIGLQLQRVTDADETESIIEATQSSIEGVRLHIRGALTCLAQRPNADTRNAIKEAVSAVESAAKVVTGRENAAFTALAQRLDRDGAHPQFVQAWKNLYNYTSDAGGVRHGAKAGDATPSVDEAKLFVITASAFTNYLVAHYGSVIAEGKA